MADDRAHPVRPTGPDAPGLRGLWQASLVPLTVTDTGAPSRGSFDRDANLHRLATEHFDVLVVGGGITGAGVALDAASRGLRTALVERDDFASGTSSKSSKMVHGGLRYLQQNEFGLVYENLAERQRLLDNAPHLVTPLPFIIPLFGRDGVVNRNVARVYRSALWLYDLTGGVRIGHRHQNLSRDEVLAHMPTLRVDRLVAGFLYWDARADDARLTLTVVRTAADHGAVVVNHAKVVSFTHEPSGNVDGARVEPDGGEPFVIRASVVVSATGVWADQVRSLDESTQAPSIRPAKGIHVTVPASVFPCDYAAVIPVPHDHRSIFAVPWGDEVYLGTTDTAWDGPLDDPICLPEDVDYVLDAANAMVDRKVTRDDVTGIWAGLRPLLAPVAGKHAPSESTADLSRRHTVRTSPEGVVTVTGGKLTTYRKMAQDTVDEVVGRLGRRPLKCVTPDLPLHGAGPGAKSRRGRIAAVDGGGDTAGAPGSAVAAAAHLAGRYGDDTPRVLALTKDRPELLDPLVPGLPYLAVEAVYAVRHEMARDLPDVLDRRTRAVLHDAVGTANAASSVAALIAPELGWTPAQARAAARRYAAEVQRTLARAGLDRQAGAIAVPEARTKQAATTTKTAAAKAPAAKKAAAATKASPAKRAAQPTKKASPAKRTPPTRKAAPATRAPAPTPPHRSDTPEEPTP